MPRLSSALVATIVITLACTAWIGGISCALVYFGGFSVTVGWIAAGVLSLIAAVVVGIFLFELRHAVDLTDTDSPPEFENRPLPAHRKTNPVAQVAPALSAQALRVSNESL
jgi:hypothetical protein